jgi:hypothetical protein
MKRKAQNLIEVSALLLLVVTLAFGVMININKLKTNLSSLSTVTVKSTTVETAGSTHSSSVTQTETAGESAH